MHTEVQCLFDKSSFPEYTENGWFLQTRFLDINGADFSQNISFIALKEMFLTIIQEKYLCSGIT